jgi:hypothetical protein
MSFRKPAQRKPLVKIGAWRQRPRSPLNPPNPSVETGSSPVKERNRAIFWVLEESKWDPDWVAALKGFEPVCLDFVPYALALTPRFLVKNISNVSNFAQTTGAGSHSINAALRGNAVRPAPRAPQLPQPAGPGSPCAIF